jgi:transketolase
VLVVLYFHTLRLDPEDFSNSKRDRFILSKGHAAPALFQVLAERGFFPVDRLDTYGEDGGVFAEHPPAPSFLNGIEAATGSLGHGLPMALGMALAGRIKKEDYKVYALLGDGECNEGVIWEAAMLASALNVGNLCVVVDQNLWQATARSSDLISTNSMADKWHAFGWNVIEIDGNQMSDVINALGSFSKVDTQKPMAIIAKTIKGKGVSFMEDDNNWHYRIPTEAEVLAAVSELSLQDSL